MSEVDEVSFYGGGRGEFDGMAAAAVRAAKVHHKEKKIRLYLIEPYLHASEYSGAAEPPDRCRLSHVTGSG